MEAPLLRTALPMRRMSPSLGRDSSPRWSTGAAASGEIFLNTEEETSMIYMLVYCFALIPLSIGSLLSHRQPACVVLRQARLRRPGAQ
jgi:hypothetical protein